MTLSPLSLDDPEGVWLMSASPKRKLAKATWLKLARQRTGYWHSNIPWLLWWHWHYWSQVPWNPNMCWMKPQWKLSHADIPNPRHRCAQSWSMWAAPWVTRLANRPPSVFEAFRNLWLPTFSTSSWGFIGNSFQLLLLCAHNDKALKLWAITKVTW